MTEEISETDQDETDQIRQEILKSSPSNKRRAFEKFVLAALGSIPWVGGFISAAASFKLEEKDILEDTLQSKWLEEHTKKLRRLSKTIEEVVSRFETLGEQINERIQSEEYLDLVRRSFRTWDRADTDEKRSYVANLIANASGTKLTSDDVVRLFIDWLDIYHEAHLALIREIYKNPGITRFEIWDNIHGDIPREDSAEADLFRLLIRDLSTGGVIRQERPTTPDGQFLRRNHKRRIGSTPTTMESAFEDTKPYILTELGKQFVHYTMSEIVPRIGAETTPSAADVP